MDEIKVFEATGYDDDYYFDQRVYFEYKNRYFAYMSMGSGSGYIPNITGICYAEKPDERFLKDWNEANQYSFSLFLSHKVDNEDLDIEKIKSWADRLLSSGKESIEHNFDDGDWEWNIETGDLEQSKIVYLRL